MHSIMLQDLRSNDFLGCHFFDTHRTELYNVKLEQKTLYIYIKNYFSSINSKVFKEVYRILLFCRRVDIRNTIFKIHLSNICLYMQYMSSEMTIFLFSN